MPDMLVRMRDPLWLLLEGPEHGRNFVSASGVAATCDAVLEVSEDEHAQLGDLAVPRMSSLLVAQTPPVLQACAQLRDYK